MQHSLVTTYRKIYKQVTLYSCKWIDSNLDATFGDENILQESALALGFITRWKFRLELAHMHLTSATERMIHWVDHKRPNVDFIVGDFIFVKLSKE